MPLRFLLHGGVGAKGIKLFSNLKAEQVTLIGTRDLDAPEAKYLKENGIKVLSVNHISLVDTRDWISTLSQNVYIHIDLDVLNPELFENVMCPVAANEMVPDLIKTLIGIGSNLKWKAKKSCSAYAGQDFSFF